MARYAKQNGVGFKRTRADVEITVQFTPEFQWVVSVKAAHPSLQSAVEQGYVDLLEKHTAGLLEQYGGEPGPQHGLAQAALFGHTVRVFGFDIVQPVPNEAPDNGEPEPVY